LVLFTSNLAQVNKWKPGFSQRNLVQWSRDGFAS